MRSRNVRRFLIGIVALVGLVYGFFYFLSLKGDLQLPSETSNMIGAIRQEPDGSRVVVLDASGKVTESAGYEPGRSDRDLAWDPNGNRLFFISDRKDNSFHIFRWDPMRNNVPDQKSIDKAGRSNIAFDVQDDGKGELSALVAVRGTVEEFVPKTAKSGRVLPPSAKERVAGDVSEGSSSPMELIYQRFGKSFRIAKWIKNRHYIAAIMRREERGETLVIQSLLPDEEGKAIPPIGLFNAEKFYLAVDKKTGNLIISVNELMVPEAKPGEPKTAAPFRHGIFILDADKKEGEALAPITLSPDDRAAFGQPVIAPDGESLLVTTGNYTGDGGIETKGVVSMPLTLNGGGSASVIMQGAIADLSYSPNGAKIAFIKSEGGKRAIFLADGTGSNVVNLTKDSGNYSTPLFSPQYK